MRDRLLDILKLTNRQICYYLHFVLCSAGQFKKTQIKAEITAHSHHCCPLLVTSGYRIDFTILKMCMHSLQAKGVADANVNSITLSKCPDDV